MSDLATRRAARLTDLRMKLADIAATIAKATRAAQGACLGCCRGGRRSAAVLEEIDSEGRRAAEASQLTAAAIEEAERLAREGDAQEAAAVRAERAAEPKKVGAAVCALNLELDQLMRQTRECLERRTYLLNSLHREGGIDSRTAFRLASKKGVTAAAVHAGLHKFVTLEHILPANVRPLADSNRALPH